MCFYLFHFFFLVNDDVVVVVGFGQIFLNKLKKNEDEYGRKYLVIDQKIHLHIRIKKGM